MGKSLTLKRSRVLAAAIAGTFAGWHQSAQGVTYIWTGPGGTTAAPVSGNWNNAANWSGGLPISANAAELDFNGSGGVAYTATDDIAGSFILNILKLGSTDTAVTEVISDGGVTTNNLSLSNNGATGATITQSGAGAFNLQIGLVLTGTSAVTLGGAGAGQVTLSGPISGASALTISGSNYTFANSTANTYTGATTVSGGAVTLNATAVAISSNLTVSGGTVTYQANNQIADNRNVTANGGTIALGAFSDTVNTLTVGGGSITGAGGGIITPASTTITSGSVSAIIAGTGTLTKNGTGTGTLSGADTYSGNTTVNNGTLTLNGNGSILNSLTINIGASNTYGTLTLDNSGTNVGDRINDTAVVNINNQGGTLNYIGNAASSSETFATLGINSGIGVLSVSNSTAGASAQLNIGNLTHTLGALDFRGSGGTLGTAGNNPRVVFTTAPATAGQIIGGWATVNGSDFAAYDATSGVVVFTGYTPLPASGLDGNTNYEAAGNQTLTAGGSINSLKLDAASNQTIDLGANNVAVNGGGILKTGGSTGTITGAGTLSAVNEMIMHVYGGNLVVNAPLSITGANPRLTKPGTGKLTVAVSGSSPAWMSNQVTFDGTLELNTTGDQTLSGLMVGNGAFNKTGPGTLHVTNTSNNFTGNASILGGTLEMLSTSTAQNLRLDAVAGQLGSSANLSIDGATLKLTTVANGSTTGNITLGRTFNFGVNGGLVDITNSIGGTLGGGTTTNIGSVVVGGGGGQVPVTTTAGGQPAIFRFNGGQASFSDPTNFPNWNTGGNALRFGALTGTGPIRVEVSNGATVRQGTGASGNVNVPMAFTIVGPVGGDSSSGPNATNNVSTITTTGRIATDNFSILTYQSGLFLQGALQMAVQGAARAIDGNVTVQGLASGNPGFVTFAGRGTGTALGTTLQAPGAGSAGLNPLYIGNGGDDTLTIEDGAIASMDLRIRVDQANHNGILLDAKTVINPGGTLRFTQSASNASISGFTGTASGNVGYHIVRNSITGQGSTAKESNIELFLPAANTTTFSATNGVDFTGGPGATGSNNTSIIVNGSGLGGLTVKGLSRPTALLGGADPIGNDAKVANLLTQGRLAALAGTGGYLTPAPQGATFTFPTGGEWGAAVPVGLKTVNSNAGGVDVSLPANSTWSHNLHVDTGAELSASGVTVNLGKVSGFGTITSGAGASGLTIGAGANLSPGASTGIITSNGDITLAPTSTFTAELNGNTAGTGYDQLNVLGAVTLNQPVLAATLGYDPANGDALTIINNDGTDAVTGSFAGLPQGAPLPLTNPGTGNTFVFIVSYTGGDGNDVVLTAGVPEPGTLGLIGLAGAAVLARRRRRGVR